MNNSDSSNRYSADWIETFLAPFDPAQTAREIEFLKRQLPLPRFRRVLDLCCGAGRHAIALANAGYDVVGVERDPSLVEGARNAKSSARFVQMDLRELDRLDETFDAAICMWQSFGYFDSATNDAVLRSVARKLRPDGRFILDIYNAAFFESRQGVRKSTVRGRTVVETKHVRDGRLHVHIDYDNGAASDDFDWELFTPESIRQRATRTGFSMIDAYTNFAEAELPGDASPRMQITLQSVRRA